MDVELDTADLSLYTQIVLDLKVNVIYCKL